MSAEVLKMNRFGLKVPYGLEPDPMLVCCFQFSIICIMSCMRLYQSNVAALDATKL